MGRVRLLAQAIDDPGLDAVEHLERRDIDRLEGTLKAINIWGGPFLVCLIGLFVWYRQKRKATA